jgi:hypothetical protein
MTLARDQVKTSRPLKAGGLPPATLADIARTEKPNAGESDSFLRRQSFDYVL